MLLLLISVTVSAKIAVFTDGRALKVDDAYLDAELIVLVLPGGGTLEVPAVRIDRVVTDEVVVEPPEPIPEANRCPAGWEEAPIPRALPFAESIERAARAADLHPWLLAALVQAESAFDAHAVSRAGAGGLTQLMPAAAADHDVRDVFDAEENLRGGATHLRRLLDRFGSLPLALAAYNAGASTVERHNGIPPYRETHDYVRRVLAVFCPEP